MKLIIHMGYPKTATTTLQNAVLEKLHKQGYINFLGRSNNINFDYNSIVGYLLGNINLEEINFDNLTNEKINVISEEVLTLGFYIEKKYLVVKNKKVILDRLKLLKYYYEKLFSDKLDTELIVVLRNQADLLESLYHEMYYAFSKVDDLNTSEKFIKALNKNEYEDFFNNFDFKIFKLYEDSFNINILFYEDIGEDVFFQQLADILKCDSYFIKEMFLNNSLNNRKFKGNIIEKKIGVSSLLIEFLYNTNMINVYFKIQKLLFVRKVFRGIKYLFDNIKYKKIKTRRFTEEEKVVIYNYYKSKNRSLLKYNRHSAP